MNHDLEARLFKAWYIARWSIFVPFMPHQGQADSPHWYDQLGERDAAGFVLIDIYPLKHAQVEELQRIWEIES